jgi:tetratricopeptide (TPR) repeat protein
MGDGRSGTAARIVLVGVLATACSSAGRQTRPAPAPKEAASCVELKRLVATTYAFRPSKVAQAERDAKAKEMDRVWNFAEAHAAEVTPCLRRMLEQPDASAFFRFDGASLLVKLDPSPASKGLEARLWLDAPLEDVDPKTWVEILAQRGLEGFDVSKAGRRWLTEPGLRYFLEDHGAYEVTPYDGAVFLFGSMDEKQARPALIDIARDPKHPGRLSALWLLLFQATPEARDAIGTLPTVGIPAAAQSAVTETIGGSSSPNKTPYKTIPTVTRAELLSAFAARARHERAVYDGLVAQPRFIDSAAQVLLPADEPQLRALRRQLVARCNQHGIDDYIVLSTLLREMHERVRRARAPAAIAPVDEAIPSTSPALAAFDVATDALPPGVTLTAGEPTCVSTEPLTFFAQPAAAGAPKPRARRAMVMKHGAGLIGSVLMFEYQAGELPKLRQSLDGVLWGDEHAPSALHPEQLAVAGNTLLILCLEGQDPAIAWYKNHLYERHHARVSRECDGLAAVQRDLEHLDKEGAVSNDEAVRRVLSRNEAALLACSAGASLLGETARADHDWPLAEKAFRRAIELDDKGDALPTPEAQWSARDGLALAVSMEGHQAASVPLFEVALSVARKANQPKLVGAAHYDLACAYAEVGKFSQAAQSLKEAIKTDAKYKAQARADDSFRKALGKPQFKWLAE